MTPASTLTPRGHGHSSLPDHTRGIAPPAPHSTPPTFTVACPPPGLPHRAAGPGPRRAAGGVCAAKCRLCTERRALLSANRAPAAAAPLAPPPDPAADKAPGEQRGPPRPRLPSPCRSGERTGSLLGAPPRETGTLSSASLCCQLLSRPLPRAPPGPHSPGPHLSCPHPHPGVVYTVRDPRLLGV